MPAWRPTTEAEILDAITTGDLHEHHGLDVKREIGDSNSPRRETARDLASFAIDGGALLIGVDEDKQSKTFSPAPLALANEPERIEQIAATRVDPPLFVQVREIPCENKDGRGYLWVDIPPSPQAPHMVGGEYWGRIERTKGRLTDAQVVRLHSQRRPVHAQVMEYVDEEIHRDPTNALTATEGHLYLVAWPMSAQPEAALPVLRDREMMTIHRLINSAEAELSSALRPLAPSPTYATLFRARSEGLAMTSLAGEGSARSLGETKERGMVDFEFREDGGIRVLVGRMTGTEGSTRSIYDGMALAYAHRVIRWAREYGSAFGYNGQWAFGLAAGGLKDLASSVFQRYSVLARPTFYDADWFRSSTVATSQELDAQPWEVAGRLVGKLLRGLTTDRFYQSNLNAPES